MNERISVIALSLALALAPAAAFAGSRTLSNADLGNLTVSIAPDGSEADGSQAAQVAVERGMAARPVTLAEATAAAKAPSLAAPSRIVLHLTPSADIVILSTANGAVRDLHVNAGTGTVEVQVGGSTISITASGIKSISFER